METDKGLVMDVLSEAWNQWSARGTSYLSYKSLPLSLCAAEGCTVDLRLQAGGET